MATVELEIEESALVVAALREDSEIDFSRCKPSELVRATEEILEGYCRLMIDGFARGRTTSYFGDMDAIKRDIADQIRADRIFGKVSVCR